MEFDNTNRGVLFKNDRKEKDTHPTHTGSLNVEGKEYYLNAWVKESASGNKFFSISIKAKEPKPQETQAFVDNELDDEVAF